MYEIKKGNLEELYSVAQSLQKLLKKHIFIHAEDFQTKNVVRIQGEIKWIDIHDRHFDLTFNDFTTVFIDDKTISYISYRISIDLNYDEIWIYETV